MLIVLPSIFDEVKTILVKQKKPSHAFILNSLVKFHEKKIGSHNKNMLYQRLIK